MYHPPSSLLYPPSGAAGGGGGGAAHPSRSPSPTPSSSDRSDASDDNHQDAQAVEEKVVRDTPAVKRNVRNLLNVFKTSSNDTEIVILQFDDSFKMMSMSY